MNGYNIIVFSKHFPSDRYRSYDEAEKNLSMVLVNGHFSQGAVRPNLPAIVDVGGLQIKPKPDPLPTVSNFLINVIKYFVKKNMFRIFKNGSTEPPMAQFSSVLAPTLKRAHCPKAW